MDALLPSEIARLVFGYLQEQKCEEAAKVFMETSTHLQECRIVARRGGKYSTKVGGLSLIDILDKYCTANAMVQEKLNKVSDCEQLKNCTDLLEQLRYLLEGTRGHRFVVNISVPSQSSSTGTLGSPNVSGSARKRRHSNSERGKRVTKSLNNVMEKSNQNLENQYCDTVEATPLETLPGHTISTKQIDTDNFITVSNEKYKLNCIANTLTISPSTDGYTNLNNKLNVQNSNSLRSKYKDQSTETIAVTPEDKKNKCTAGTNTERSLNRCTVEVQTGPFDFLESESDVNDEPIENLSILTKELLQRTELHERIAENINKTILPVESSDLLEDNIHQKVSEANVSLLSDFGNAIKSVVKATETDPVFEGFLKEIFTVSETDTSPDEDSDTRQNQITNNKICTQKTEPMEIDHNCELIESTNSIENEQKINKIEVPLKQRLRSSSKSLTTNLDEEEKESISLLENQNAEAVASIVNVITNRRNSLVNNDLNIQEKPTLILPEIIVDTNLPINLNTESDKTNDVKIVKSVSKKSTNKKPKLTKPKPDRIFNETNAQLISEKEILTMPTLILCSEKEMEPFLPKPKTTDYIPIAPKPAVETATPSIQIYLRTVNVPRHLVNPAQIEASAMLQQTAATLQHPIVSGQLQSDNMDSSVVPIVVADEKPDPSCTAANSTIPVESITLYGGQAEEPCSAEVKGGPARSLGMINIDDDTFGLSIGSGLSPLLKNASSNVQRVKQESKKSQLQVTSKDVENITKPTMEFTAVEQVTNSKITEVTEERKQDVSAELKKSKINEFDVIAKNTPRTLMKSRAKNNRLSLSTPRRRNSHIRALDFSTPAKLNDNTHKSPLSSTKSKSICRGKLFKSPSYSETASPATKNISITGNTQSVKTALPVDSPSVYMQVPIATRSPAPKLQGNWGKVTGIGLILGETSQSESSPEKSQSETFLPALSPDVNQEVTQIEEKEVPKKDWDSELRKIVGSGVQEGKNLKSNNEQKTMNKKNACIKVELSTDLKDKSKEQDVTVNKKVKNNDVNKITKGEKEANSKKCEKLILKNNADSKIKISPPTLVVKNNSLQLAKTTKSVGGKKAKVSLNALDSESCLPNIPDYVTPRKTATKISVPPTPRLHTTPADSLKCNRPKSNLDRSIKAGGNTPDFPVTPCIVLTPKIMEEEEQEKRPSPYYEPSEEILQAAKDKEVIHTVTISVNNAVTQLKQKDAFESQENHSVKIKKNEIVEKKIEEEDETEEDSMEKKSKEIVEDESVEETIISTNSNSDSCDESDSNSSNTSSSSNNSSSTSSYSDATSSPTKSITADDDCQNDNSTTESEIHSPEKILQNFSKVSQENIDRVEIEESLFKESTTTVNDTIDDLSKNKLSKKKTTLQKNISERSCTSNTESTVGYNSHTNLTSKVLIVDTTFQGSQNTKMIKECQNNEIASSIDKVTHPVTEKLKITNAQKAIPAEEMTLQVSQMLQSEMQKSSAAAMQQQQVTNNDAKLAQELEEKRLRLMAKFKEASNSKLVSLSKKPAAVKKILGVEKSAASLATTLKNKSNIQVKKIVAKSEELPNKTNNTQLDSNESKDPIKQLKKCKSKTSPKKKTIQNNQQCKIDSNNIVTNSKNIISENIGKEVEISTISVAVENSKGILKTKVDQVKRDLFNEEEINDQRTTRSQAARRSVDNPKNDENRDVNASLETSKESLPGVLECLELIPANKSELDLSSKSVSSEGLSNNETNALEFTFTYDESVPIKKRKCKYSNSELVTEYTLDSIDEEESRALNVTAYEEMFKMAPKHKKKTSKTSPVKKKNKSCDRVEKKSVTTSSPLTKVQTMKKCHKEDKRRKCSKRKSVPIKDEQVEKKSKPDPQTLLNKIKIDEFLKSVHIPQ